MDNTDNTVTVLYWNPGGVSDKLETLRLLLHHHNPHLLLLGETKLRPFQPFRVPNYHVYRRDEVSPRGIACRGTAVIVRRDLVHEELEHPNCTHIRANGIRLKVAGRELKIFAGYRPPKPDYNGNDLSKIFSDSTPTLLAADLNAKHVAWGSRSTLVGGRKLMEESERLQCQVNGPDSPTHLPSNPRHAPDVLDIIVHRGLCCPVSVDVLYDGDTQHLPIIINIDATATAVPRRRQVSRTNWTAYTDKLQDVSLGRLSAPHEVETAARLLLERMKAARDSSTTTTDRPPARGRAELPTRLSEAISRKRALRRQWAMTRCPQVKRRLNALTAQVSEDVKKWRGDTWESVIDRVADNIQDLRQLNRALQARPPPTYPLLDSTGTRRFAPQDRAELFATHLEGQFSPHPVPTGVSRHIRDHHRNVENTVREILDDRSPLSFDGIEFFSPSEVSKLAKRLNRRKAPGVDDLPPDTLINLPRRGYAALTALFNGILRTAHFPDVWKKGKVIMLPKPGKDRRLPASYRPITLLPHVAKLFERLLLRRMSPHFEYRVEQYGFRSGHSTTLQLTRVLHKLAYEWNRRYYTVGVFLDIEKAFDRVWHAGLLFKLMTNTTLPPTIVRLLASYLQGRSFCVSVERTSFSTERTITAGVPQGSCLSPALYGLYTNDIPDERDVMLALFADDSAYFASSITPAAAARKVQRVLDKLPDWLDKWRISVNVDKTAALLVSHRRPVKPPLRLRNKRIDYSTSVKYLGVIIDRTLSMTNQATAAINSARTARGRLRPVLESKLPLRTKIGVYKTYIRPRLTYATPSWFALCSEGVKRRIQTQQNLILRLCTGAARYVRNDVIARDLNVESISEFVARLTRRMFYKQTRVATPTSGASPPSIHAHQIQ